MILRRSGLTSLLGTIVALVALAACGSGSVKAASASVDDLVRSVNGVDDTARLSRALKTLNSGQLEVDQKVANQFTANSGVVRRIMSRADVDVGLACDAYEAGYDAVEARQGTNRVTAQGHLNDMRTQVSAGEASALTVKFACQVQEALSDW